MKGIYYRELCIETGDERREVVLFGPINLKPIFHCNTKFWRQNFALGIPTCWYLKMLKFALPPTRHLKLTFHPTQNIKESQWNIGGVGSSGVGHVHISCIFHVVCASFSGLATRKLADAKADSIGIQA